MGKTICINGLPLNVNLSALKSFVERYTGQDTVYALRIRPGMDKWNSEASAMIEFTSEESATCMMSQYSRGLQYFSHKLYLHNSETDIIQKPRSFLLRLKNVKLNFGWAISIDTYSILWKKANVSVDVDECMHKWRFFLSHDNKQYKLELSYENIWKIESRPPRGGTVKYLLFQLLGAPRIFEIGIPTSTNINLDPSKNYYKDTPDEYCIRATDFTPSGCIGHSSVLCLELPIDQDLPNFRAYFESFHKSKRRCILETGFPFSHNLNIVPIVAPPEGVDIPFPILFKVNSLVQHGCFSGSELDTDFFRLIDPSANNISFIKHALEEMECLKNFCYEPRRWLEIQYKKYLDLKNPPWSPTITLREGLVYVHRVQITPCKVYFCGPEITISNRVLRHFHQYINHFLRVSFVDEELGKLYSTELSPHAYEGRKSEIYNRIFSILRDGIVIGDKKFEFLAFSPSQLRENSLWMFTPTTTGCTASGIREWLGDFRHIRNVAKYAARLGLSFGSSTETLSVQKNEIEIIPDVKVTCGGNEYVFSDGIGKISLQFAEKVAQKCGYNSPPSAFQIRYGGYKGVVAVDPTSSVKLSLRNSMHKYDSENTELDVLLCSKFQPCYLNRQLITLLSTLGVEDSVFEKKQREAINQLNTIITDSWKAKEVLDLMSSGEITNILKEMLNCGYKPNGEPFLSMMLQTFRASKLLEMRQKSRIFIPKGRAMIGCLDETRTLEYGEVFVQYSNNRAGSISDDFLSYGSANSSVIKGKVVVAKNPCLHPGDVRVLTAVDVQALHHMVDCVVFPQKGERPHPNECSGSDLDGDVYFVSWDIELIPPKQVKPMDYTPPKPIELDHDVMMEEVQEYFTNFMLNDTLGIISSAHTVFADNQPDKAMADLCVELAKLFSIAVDFPKTGIPAAIRRELHPKEYPDFMENPYKPTYVSHNVIGRLFREVVEVSKSAGSIKSFTLEVARQSYDRDMEVDGFEQYVKDALLHKSNYDYKLATLMDYYRISTEAEILSGNVLKKSKFSKDADVINMAVRSLRKQAKNWFNNNSDNNNSDNSSSSSGSSGSRGVETWTNDAYAKASAWYHVTYHPNYWGHYNEGMGRDHFLSFPWCVYRGLVQIKAKAMKN